MYSDFFGFQERPFNVTPDPDFIYYSDQHKEALAHMLYGVQDRKGFILITGRVGSGKTTLCRAFLQELDSKTSTALVLNTTMDSLELLQTIADDFGLKLPADPGVKQIIDKINSFVLSEYKEGRNVCVIIDEAQNLSPEVLEHLRLLSNLETNKEKLLQMILVGQPELNNLLNRKQLRQLKQRVTVRSFLSNLTPEETRKYVLHRMNQAKPAQPIQLDSKIFPRLYAASGGNPRAINLICDRMLMAAYIDETFSISTRHLKRALDDLSDETENPVNARVLHRLKRFKRNHWKNKMPMDFLTRAAAVAVATFLIVITGAWMGGFFNLEPEVQISPRLSKAKISTEKNDSLEENAAEKRKSDTAVKVTQNIKPANKLNVPVLDKRPDTQTHMGLLSLGRYLSYIYPGEAKNINWRDTETINHSLKPEDVIEELNGGHLVQIGPSIDNPFSFGFPALLEFSDGEYGKRYLLYLPQEDKIWDPLQGWIEPRRGIFSRTKANRGWLLVKTDFDPNQLYGPGDSGTKVFELQKLLNKAGDYQIPLEYEFFGNMTEAAVRDFQKDNYLYVDGMAGPQTNLYLLKKAGVGIPHWDKKTIDAFIERLRTENVTD